MVDTLLDEKGYKVLREDCTYQDWESIENLAYCSDGKIREYAVSEYGSLRLWGARDPENKKERQVMDELLEKVKGGI